MSGTGSNLLAIGAALSALAAVAHVGIVIGGASWYRAFGAGEGMARLAESGSWYPGLITFAIAIILAGWAAYALSGAGLLPAFPYVRSVLVVITGIYLLRGVAGLLLAVVAPGDNGVAFWVWSSAICLLFGAVHAVGLVKVWPALSGGHT